MSFDPEDGRGVAEQAWAELSSNERWLLERLGGLDNGEVRYEPVQLRYELGVMDEKTAAAMTVLLSKGFVDVVEEGRKRLYGVTPSGDALLLLGRPEELEEAKETARVQKYLSRLTRRAR